MEKECQQNTRIEEVSSMAPPASLSELGRQQMHAERVAERPLAGPGRIAYNNRRRDCYFGGAPSASLLRYLLKRDGGRSQMAVAPSAVPCDHPARHAFGRGSS